MNSSTSPTLHLILFAGGLASAAAPLCRGEPPAAGTVVPLSAAHAHNDYEHARPLLDALDQGFTSVEADIHLIDGRLLVAHDAFWAHPHRTLEKLYLEPLQQRVRENGGRVYRAGPPFTLLVDIKSDAEKTYAALDAALQQYAPILTAVEEGVARPGAIHVIVSGNCPRHAIAAQKLRYAAVDGRLTDLDSDEPAHLLPLVSDNWKLNFSWSGRGDFPPPERRKLRDVVERAHAKGRRVRFWGTPDTAEMWRELSAAQADLVNTDDLAGLARFLRQQADRPKSDN